MAHATKDSGSMVGEMAWEFKSGQMAKSMKASGKKVVLMGLDG